MPHSAFARLVAASLVLLTALAAPVRANGDEPPAKSFAALEVAGVRIGTITVRAEDIFDTTDARGQPAVSPGQQAAHPDPT